MMLSSKENLCHTPQRSTLGASYHQVVSVHDAFTSVFCGLEDAELSQMRLSAPPKPHSIEQASALSLAYSLTCNRAELCGNGSLANPAQTLRDVRVAMAILQHAPLAMADDLEANRALQVGNGV